MSPFVASPWLALLPAVLFSALYGLWRNRGSLVAALLWLAYCPYEYAMKLHILCSGDCNIRVDLLLLYPVLLAMSIVALLARQRT